MPWLTGVLDAGMQSRLVLPPGTIRCELFAGHDRGAGGSGQAQSAVLREGEEARIVFELAPLAAPR